MFPQPHLQLIYKNHHDLIVVIQVVLHPIRLFFQRHWNVLDESIRSLKCVRDFRIVIGNRPNRWLRDRDASFCQERCLLGRLHGVRPKTQRISKTALWIPSFIHSPRTSTYRIAVQRLAIVWRSQRDDQNTNLHNRQGRTN